MKCWKCGRENADDDIFCIYCGSELRQARQNANAASEKRSVQSILEEYLPQLPKQAASEGKFIIAPNIDNGNCQQVFDEMLKFLVHRKNRELVINSIYENGEKIQGMFVSGYSKLKYLPTVLIFSDQALYAFWNMFPSWYLPASGDKKKFVIDCKCRYDAIDRVSVIPTKLGEGLSGFGMSKVSCSLLNSTNLFEFSFDSHYIQEDKLAEMVVLLAANGRRK